MLYGRFLDIHIGNLGHYDFESDIVNQMEREGNKLSHSRTRMNWSPWAGGSGRNLNVAIPETELPTRGVIVIGVEVSDIDNTSVMAGIQSLVEWVNDKAHSGKIRFNVHGTETGGLTMKDAGGTWAETPAVNAARWLCANGLEHVKGRQISRAVGIGRGLTTVAFAICMGGRSDTTGAKLNFLRTKSQPAPQSTVAQFGGHLSGQDIKGIKITGANEIVAGGGGKHAGTWGRSVDLPQGPGWERKVRGPGGSWIGRGILTVPAPFEIAPTKGYLSRGVIKYPSTHGASFSQQHDGYIIHQGGQGIALIPDTGWITDTASRTIKAPVGWTMKPNRKGQPGGKIYFTLKNTSVDMATGTYWQRLTRTPYKVRMYT